MTLAALALTKSVFTSNTIAGNLSFRQSASSSADAGVEAAVAWLNLNNGKPGPTATANVCVAANSTTVLACDQNAFGYSASVAQPGTTWMNYWNITLQGFAVQLNAGAADTAGNVTSYAIERLCSIKGDLSAPNQDCSASPSQSSASTSGSNNAGSGIALNSPISQMYYRITVNVAGPRNTQSLTQVVVAM